MNKIKIRNFAEWARDKLIADITFKARELGINENGISEKLPQSTSDLEFYDIGTREYKEVSGNEVKQRQALVTAIRAKERATKDYKEAYDFIIEEVAYTWFNRLIAIRFMEVNNYLPAGIRVLSSENKLKNEPDLVTNPFEADLDLSFSEQEKVFEFRENNKSDELFRMLFIKQCNKLYEILPRLFEKTDDYSELLLSISYTDNDGIIYRLTHDIEESNFNITKEGQIEIIGWLYQYYNIAPKAAVFARPKNKKIKKEQIPAATQLFTPQWIVRYMVENSLGRLWYEGHNNSTIKSNWKYYIDEATQTSEVMKKLSTIKQDYKTIKPEDIKLIDPCMGSGHILIYAFDVLMQIYESYGYIPRDAASLIVENNIYGLDIDERAAQLAYFAVMMKGRQYDRKFFTRGITPHIYDIPELAQVQSEIIDEFDDCADIARRLCDTFYEGKEYGSLLKPPVSIKEIEQLNKKIIDMSLGVTNIFSQIAINTVAPIIDITKMLVQKYDIVVTNPPYMSVSNVGTRLNNYVKKNYPDSKSDLFSVFIEHGKTMLKKDSFLSMITMHSWMFLSSFVKLRTKLLLSDIDAINMIHLGANAFEEISGEVVQTTSFVFRNSSVQGYKGTYCRLTKPNTQQSKEDMFLRKENRFEIDQLKFSKITGNPIVYWVNEKIFSIFDVHKKLKLFCEIKNGMSTTDNNRFLRYWYECPYNGIGFSLNNAKAAKISNKRWFPYNKGGVYRKWYGNISLVVNWKEDGKEIKKAAEGASGGRIVSQEFYFLESLSWSKVTAGRFALRYFPAGFLFDVAGPSIFADRETQLYILALMNSNIKYPLLEELYPTINYEMGQVAATPFIMNKDQRSNIIYLAQQNINLTKVDWDSFETSWDFDKHPFVKYFKILMDSEDVVAVKSDHNRVDSELKCPLELCYQLWNRESNERFNKLKCNEIELNRIFIDTYELNNELSDSVEDKDISVRKADVEREVKSLLSYAVGCMFGRYSLDIDGLVYAGGEWDNTKYNTYIPDKDNCISITDEEYFDDDIVGRFCEFIEIVFGKDSLELNLRYIANALENRGNTSREVIRNYFLNDFIKDHIKIYQKRPIYWLFESGKQNGFKALCYMHRWNADTIGNMRVDYLHQMQKVYDKEIERMQEIIDNSHDNRTINKAIKRKEKLQKQLKETKDYDALVAHLAHSRINIDLDDGVKINYEKVQTTIDGEKLQILAKI